MLKREGNEGDRTKVFKRARQYIIAYYAIENHTNEYKTLTVKDNNKKDFIIDLTGAEESTVVKVDQTKKAFIQYTSLYHGLQRSFITSEFVASVERM